MTNEDHSAGNKKKVQAGIRFKNDIALELDQLKDDGLIKDYSIDEKFSHPNYAYPNQFKTDFIIETVDCKFIAVRSSVSFEHGRAKSAFYDLECIEKYSRISGELIATALVISNDKTKNRFSKIQKKYLEKEYFAPISKMFTLHEFTHYLQNYAIGYLSAIESEKQDTSPPVPIDPSDRGSYYGIAGNDFEREFVQAANNPVNIEKLKSNNLESHTVLGVVLPKIISILNIDVQTIIGVEATNSIEPLLSGGPSKTDIILKFVLINNGHLQTTLSLKNTNQESVTCHDYTFERFVEVLGCANTRLAFYLEHFQQNPSYSRFEKSLPKGYSVSEFKSLLTAKMDLFTEWVLSGRHDSENLISPDDQTSNFLLFCQKGKILFYSVEEYIQLLYQNMESKSTFHYGVPFYWTRPSGQEGKRIQLKVPVLSE